MVILLLNSDNEGFISPRNGAVTGHSPDNRIALEGEWDLDQKKELNKLFDSLSSEMPATIDVRALTYLDSCSLDILCQLLSRFGETPITLVGPNVNIRRLLKITGLEELVRIVDKDDEP